MYRLAGVVAPLANLASVNFHKEGSNVGRFEFYANIESTDERFMDANFRDDKYTLWDNVQGKYPRWDTCRNHDAVAKLECQEGCDASSQSLIESLFSVTGGCKPASVDLGALWTRLDQHKFLLMTAVDRVVGHWDSLCGPGIFGKNYLPYYSHSTDRFAVIPWGTDHTLERSSPRDKNFHGCSQMKAVSPHTRATFCYRCFSRPFKVPLPRASEPATIYRFLLPSSVFSQQRVREGLRCNVRQCHRDVSGSPSRAARSSRSRFIASRKAQLPGRESPVEGPGADPYFVSMVWRVKCTHRCFSLQYIFGRSYRRQPLSRDIRQSCGATGSGAKMPVSCRSAMYGNGGFKVDLLVRIKVLGSHSRSSTSGSR